jgi:hypothetical protein
MTEAGVKKEPAFRNKGFWIGVLIFLSIIGLSAIFSTPPTAEQQRAFNEQHQRDRDRAKARSDEIRNLCHVKSVCKAYADVRQECAVAGDFNNCVRVKIGDENMDSVPYCANDGSISSPPDNLPSWFDCLAYSLN